MPTSITATIRSEVATGRTMKGCDGFIAEPSRNLQAQPRA
jgi:hypothetical protein